MMEATDGIVSFGIISLFPELFNFIACIVNEIVFPDSPSKTITYKSGSAKLLLCGNYIAGGGNYQILLLIINGHFTSEKRNLEIPASIKVTR
jgi:hypothetical protein